ncbi:GH36-type glycosyl hydrolase domain-containing protein [Rossellomorea marisflavi]|uniref:GH36-type glycosyl hydrolase domain-containing protein n=1 Tax=Rossellomorea marisflavi TaxID=189381 RepID=UPI003514D52A
MIAANLQSRFTIERGGLEFVFLNSGDLFSATQHVTMINQVLGNPVDGSMNNLYLRVHGENGISAYPLIGIKSESTVSHTDSQVIWTGQVEGIDYRVTFTLTDKGVWFWDALVEGAGKEVDVIYAQDISIADKGAVRSNEAYVSQYIDHAVFKDGQTGYVVCSRQNQPQHSGYPYLQQGSIGKATGYSTDGFQFYGLSYKESDVPEALTKEQLENTIYQYEFAFTALQSEKMKLDGKERFTFYGLFKNDHPEAITALEYKEDILTAWETVKGFEAGSVQAMEAVTILTEIGRPLVSEPLLREEVEVYFPHRHQEETEGDQLLSFFTDTHEHVVLKEKELIVERPHGHILMSGGNVEFGQPVITTTSYMYGIFNSQLVVGNTSFNKMLSNPRNALNVFKASGQRIYVEIEGEYRLLTLPSLFEIGFNYARWYYKLADDTVIVTNFTTVDSLEVHLQVHSQNGKAYRYLVSNQVTMNGNEYDVPFKMKQNDDLLSFHADEASDSSRVYPNLAYHMKVEGAAVQVKDESTFLSRADGQASLVVLQLEESSDWSLIVKGALEVGSVQLEKRDVATEITRYRAFFRDVMNHFKVSIPGLEEKMSKVNDVAWWYTHNMLVHYSVPHGLEQYGGAAWGTRDVCQGPAEYFLATQKFDAVRDIIKVIYSHQFADDGNWPQWFMFDQYHRIKAGESHGDIIVWPLKVIADYLSTTKDFSILHQKVPYTVRGSHDFTDEHVTILEHMKKQIQYIKDNFIPGTHLSSYGDGDWDDTLQPANQQLKQYMVSSWTVALTYQVLSKLSVIMRIESEEEAGELKALTEAIKADYQAYVRPSDVVPGFLYMEDITQPEKMLHPEDNKTGINYRLLPMIRGIISELFDDEEAGRHYDLIREKFYCPDGVRLMDRPANYEGGVNKHFKRAEQASNFGREIGLQYVHAHIRFIEAMAKLGEAEEVWSGLEKINPVGIQEAVPNAERRQSNSYFSSSDGKFNTRYEAQDNFDQLRDGSVQVKGGWRIYSSGPGIYMNQLISNALGIRLGKEELTIDPVLTEDLNGLRFDYRVEEHPVTFVYHLEDRAEMKVVVNGETIPTLPSINKYRQNGVRVSVKGIEGMLKGEGNIIEIYK